MIDTNMAPYGAFLLRITSGVALLAHGLMKVFVFTMPGTVGYFESIGYRGFVAYLVIAGEVGLGTLLALGVQTRMVALAAVPILLGAAYQHLGNGWVFSAEGGGWEYPAFWTLALFVQALLSPGAFALPVSRADQPSHSAVA